MELAAAKANVQSPDLTHVRVVEEGDTLPLMAKRIYGDSKYYLEVARVNRITSFRKLKTGQRIFFPPIQKPE
jgi:nucleoid-associated protein YgaU